MSYAAFSSLILVALRNAMQQWLACHEYVCVAGLHRRDLVSALESICKMVVGCRGLDGYRAVGSAWTGSTVLTKVQTRKERATIVGFHAESGIMMSVRAVCEVAHRF